jgi:hypothetical protein
MAVKNNYWTELNRTPRFYTVWPGGWEIHIRVEEVNQYAFWHGNQGKRANSDGLLIDKKGNVLKRIEVKYDVPKGVPKESRKDLRTKIARDKRIAQSVSSRKEYEALWKRIDDEDWDFIEKNDLKDGALVSWAYNTRTADEYDRLLRYN